MSQDTPKPAAFGPWVEAPASATPIRGDRMTDRYEEWRDFYAEKVRSWMSLEELRAECGKLITTDGTSPELLLIHAMRALEEREKRDEDLLRQALEALSRAHQTAMKQTLKARIPECAEFAGIAQDLDFVVAALRERLGEKA